MSGQVGRTSDGTEPGCSSRRVIDRVRTGIVTKEELIILEITTQHELTEVAGIVIKYKRIVKWKTLKTCAYRTALHIRKNKKAHNL